jgi:predicted transposase/invertase (TIGR01784 family)
MITERDWRAIKECAREDGRAEGMEEGMAKGMAKGAMEAKMQIALKMLEMGMPVSDISEATGLDLEQVEGMRKSAE